MPPAKLPKTGYCHYCGAPTTNRFCCVKHSCAYHARETHRRKREKAAQVKYKAIKRRKYYGETKSPLTLEERIKEIASRGTTLAPR